MHRSPQLQALAGLALFALLVLITPEPRGPESVDWTVAERAKLSERLAHAEPGSPRAIKLQTKIDRIDAYREGRPQPGFPDEYARFLHERKIPSDRTTVEYEPGYQMRELQRSIALRRAPAVQLDWKERGPGNVAGRARGLIVDPDDPSGDTWFVASVGGGVWRTTDAGATWIELTQDVPNLQISAIAMAASNTDVIYAGTGESFWNIDVMNGNGILKSTDRGQTWFQLSSTVDDPRFNNVSRIIVDPTDEDVVLASTTTGRYKNSLNSTSSIFRSTDGGTTWTEVHQETNAATFGGGRVLQLIADPTDFDVQYATVFAGGVLKSTDRGLTWNYVNNGITDFAGRFELAISPVNTDYLFASAQGSQHSELWVSLDGGANWFETFESGDEPNWLGAQGWYDNTITCHPTDPTIVYVGGLELWKIELQSLGSSTRFTSRLASYSFPHPDHHDIQVVQPQGGDWYLLATSDGGIARTASFESGFTQPTDGMVTTQFYGVDKRPGASAYVGGTQDNGTWLSPVDPQATTPWSFVIGGDGYEASWHFDDPLKVIGGSQFNGLQRSLDGGITWQSARNGLEDTGSSSAPFITKIGQSKARPDVVYAVGVQGVWRSTDFGGSWDLTPIPTEIWGGLSSFHDVRVSEPDPDIVWAGSRMDGAGTLSVSTDEGLTFDPVSVYAGETLGRISGIATHPTEPNTAFALFSFAGRPKVLKTTDLGDTWTDLSGFEGTQTSTNGFPDVAVYDLVVFPNDTNRIWVGTEIGLVESLDGGATWALADNGLPSVGIWNLRVVEDEVVVGTHGRGIWSVTLPELEDGLTFNPLLELVAQRPDGMLSVDFNLRSVYDSTDVLVNGQVVESFGPNTRRQLESILVPVTEAGTKAVTVRGVKDGIEYTSVSRSVDAQLFDPPAILFSTSIDDASDFALDGLEVGTASSFQGTGLQSPHPYPDASSMVAVLTQPIRVLESSRLVYDEVVLVEPGEPGAAFGEFGFWDFAVVEGTTDGANWVPLIDGYDANADPVWLSAYNNSLPGDASMLRTREVSLSDVFPVDANVLIRFRLSSDGFVNSWGWWVDDVRVEADATDAPSAAGRVALDQNAPNPFNPNTTIAFSLPRRGPVKLQVFDVRGRLVRTLVDEVRAPGRHSVVWDGTDDAGVGAASGVYLYRLTAAGEMRQNKMTLVK